MKTKRLLVISPLAFIVGQIRLRATRCSFCFGLVLLLVSPSISFSQKLEPVSPIPGQGLVSTDGLYIRVSAMGTLSIVISENTKIRAAETRDVASRAALASRKALEIPCGDQELSEKYEYRDGNLSFVFNLKRMCLAGLGLNYVRGSKLQMRVKPNLGPIIPGQ